MKCEKYVGPARHTPCRPGLRRGAWLLRSLLLVLAAVCEHRLCLAAIAAALSVNKSPHKLPQLEDAQREHQAGGHESDEPQREGQLVQEGVGELRGDR